MMRPSPNWSRRPTTASCAALRIPSIWWRGRIALGMTGIGIADRNTVAGVVRAWVALREAQEKLAEAGLPPLRFPPDRRRAAGLRRWHAGHRRLSGDAPRLGPADPAADAWAISGGKGRLHPEFRGSARLSDDLALIVLPESSGEPQEAHRKPVPYPAEQTPSLRLVHSADFDPLRNALHRLGPRRRSASGWARACATTAMKAAALPGSGESRRRRGCRCSRPTMRSMPSPSSARCTTSSPASGWARRSREAGRALEANAERHLKPPDEMARLFRRCPEAIAETQRLLARIALHARRPALRISARAGAARAGSRRTGSSIW